MIVPARHAPVVLGSIQATSIETDAVIATDIRFPAGSVLPQHTHERTIVGIMLEGAFDSEIAGRRFGCRVETVWTEPLGERHANHIGREGARVLAIQPNPQRADLYRPVRSLLEDVRLLHTAGLRADALRLARELQRRDALSTLAIDALVMLVLVSAARLRLDQHHGRVPVWLVRARDALHAHFARPPQLAELASIADVSASHLAHAFRRHFRVTPGEYVRHVRAHWAAEQVATTDRPLVEIALRAGYSDQSHFTREFRRVLGASPGVYRDRLRR